MPLTSLQVYLQPPDNRTSSLPLDDLYEFSRNERGRERVLLFFFPTPNDLSIVGEEIVVKLFKNRRNRDEEVKQAEQSITLSFPVPTLGFQVSLDLRRTVYSSNKPFPILRRGEYFFRLLFNAGSSFVDSPPFRIALMTTDRLEAEWLLGTTRRSNDDRAVRFQPKRILGVKVIEVSRNHPLDLFPLTLGFENSSPKRAFLSWNKGERTDIDLSIPGGINNHYLLKDHSFKNYIIVDVDSRLLPSSDTSESLLIDRALIDRETLRRWLDEEADQLESSFLFAPLEPSLIVSDYRLADPSPFQGEPPFPPVPPNSDFDILASPVTYFPPSPGHWINLQVPFGLILHFEYLLGALENKRIFELRTEWITYSRGRQIQLLPYNQSLVYNFLGLMYLNAMRGPVEIPSFWRYRYWAGIHDETTPLDIIELFALKASIKALAVLGQMFRGGFSSQSVSRDGVSESVGYTASAMYGIYSATIEEYRKKVDILQKQVKRRYLGLPLSVL